MWSIHERIKKNTQNKKKMVCVLDRLLLLSWRSERTNISLSTKRQSIALIRRLSPELNNFETKNLIIYFIQTFLSFSNQYILIIDIKCC
jgi:hypothetical protein